MSNHAADPTREVLELAQQLVRIPSVTGPHERLDEVWRAARAIRDHLREGGLEVTDYDQGRYPAVFAAFPGRTTAAVMLSGHFDVVAPEPDDTQFEPRLEGDYLWGRGSADMKVVVATFMVWMRDTLTAGPPFPDVNLLLVGNEENGEAEPFGTPHVLADLARRHDGYAPALLVAGERTGEKGTETWGQVCVENRGVMHLELSARGVKGHSALAEADLADLVFEAHAVLGEVCRRHLTLEGSWRSQYRFPFVGVGEPGVFTVTPERAVLGIEVRSIPGDDLDAVLAEVRAHCTRRGLELRVPVKEGGVACDLDNPYLLALLQAVRDSGAEPILGKKLPGSSARFAPRGQGVVWGQTGIGPHARFERHFVPSIAPYYRALGHLGRALRRG